MRLSRSAWPNALLYLTTRLRSRPRGEAYKRLVIYKVDRLGDFVLSLGAIGQLIEANGIENCVLVGSRFSRELAQSEFPGLEVVEVSCGHNRLWKTCADLRQLRSHPLFTSGAETMVCLRHHRTLHDDTLIGAIPAAQTWGVVNSSLTDAAEQLVQSRLRFDHLVDWPERTSTECAELAAHRRIVSAVLGREILPADIQPVLAGIPNPSQPYAVVSPFGSDVIRDLTVDQLVAAADELYQYGCEVRLLAEPRHQARYEALAVILNAKLRCPVTVLVTATMNELVGQVRQARLVLCVETVTAHLATAMDKAMVATLGGGHYGWFAPWQKSARQQWVTHQTECYGCNWHCIHPNPICLTDISADQMRAAVKLALSLPAN